MTERRERPLYTIGHSTHTLEDFIAILRAYGVTHLIDIRTISRSLKNPQFNEATLPRALEAEGLRYTHVAELGGLRHKSKSVDPEVNGAWEVTSFHNYADYAESAPFRRALTELIHVASEETTAIMCAEAVWWRCHRRIVADHLIAKKVRVIHVFSETKAQEATLTPFAVVSARGRVSYPRLESSGHMG